MTTALQVHLQAWMLDDGAVEPLVVGERTTLGLGLDLEQLPIAADERETDGVTPLPDRGDQPRARADVVGRVRVVLDGGGTPFGALVSPVPEIALVVVGPGSIDLDWDGRRVVVRGDVVAEPYLWEDGGVFRTGAECPPRAAVVERIRTVARAVDPAQPDSRLVDVRATAARGEHSAGYLVDLRFDVT